MSKPSKKRLDELEQRIHSIPISTAAVRKAFEVFQRTGELPEDVRLGYEVVRWVQNGAPLTWADASMDMARSIREHVERPARAEDPRMGSLYDEALFGSGMVKDAARGMLRGMAKVGLDPSLPQFVGQPWDPAERGNVGVSLMGFPECLAKAPYEEQAERLFARLDLLQVIAEEDRRWLEQLDYATEMFQQGGEWPSDPVALEAILVLGEIDALVRHAAGEDVSVLMAAFDAAATATGDERTVAVGRVQELARTG